MGHDRRPDLWGVCAAFYCLALATVSLRCYVRVVLIKSFWWDDAMSVAALLVYSMFCACAVAGTFYGAGQKLPGGDLSIGLKFFWLSEVGYVLAVTLAKISAALCLLRITLNRPHIWILYGYIAVSSTTGFMWLVVMLAQCTPPSYFWNKTDSAGSCMDINVILNITYVYSAISAISDFVIGLLPIFVLRKSNMRSRIKVALVGILGLACIASAAVIIRLPYLPAFREPDFLYATVDLAIWSNVEAGLSISGSGFATLRPLFRKFHNSIAGSSGRTEATTSGHRYQRAIRLPTIPDDDCSDIISPPPKAQCNTPTTHDAHKNKFKESRGLCESSEEYLGPNIGSEYSGEV